MLVRKKLRSAKFAEYLSTYAILNLIGLHPTTLIERRDSARGVAVHVRDACDAGTCVLVVPTKRLASNTVFRKIGTKIRLRQNEHTAATNEKLDQGVVTFLTQCDVAGKGSVEWIEWCWRVGIELHRGYSTWWGWLQNVPTLEEFEEMDTACASACRLQHASIFPFYKKSRSSIEKEVREAYESYSTVNMMPCYAHFRQAVLILLSRGTVVPIGWHGREETTSEECEVAVIPFVDNINGPDRLSGATANCVLETAITLDELPSWYTSWVLYESEQKSVDGMAQLEESLRENYYVCATLTKPLLPSEEVILSYTVPQIGTGVLSPTEDARLSRFVKYFY
ncbi:hypothetical protein AGDE_07374 [Angomonas deanei]|nr:hypothetical protein AGDE_07374 [Angomonas deanei]|eukprot:EPY35410.1 hypothetical protein AGDE_07374 [Angomonas deanei]